MFNDVALSAFVVALGVDAALRLLAGVELAAGVRVAVVVALARAHLGGKGGKS